MASRAPLPLDPAIAAWKTRLTEGRALLREHYFASRNAAFLLHRHSDLVDGLLCAIWTSIGLPETLSLLAVGGFGRQELYPYSDVDILILVPANHDPNALQKLERVIGIFWDIGLEVGHSVRSIDECLAESEKDVTVRTNLLESRYLCGNTELRDEFQLRFQHSVDPVLFYEAKMAEQKLRHLRYHGTAYNLEPNLKESPGGLRDLQNILWVSRAMGTGVSWQELAGKSLISPGEAKQIRRHELCLQNLRIRLHYLAKRREDRLLFDVQNQLAQDMSLTSKGLHLASEQLMQRYYRTAKAVDSFNELLLLNLRERLLPATDAVPRIVNPRFQARHGLLECIDENLYQQEPGAILETFLLLEQHPELEGLAPQTLRMLSRAKSLINAEFRRRPENRALFLKILFQPQQVTHTLRRMNRYGLLGRYLPAFGRIVGQMQHDLFHAYTVDEHILFVVRNLRRFTVTGFAHEFPLCSQLIAEFEQPGILMISALFHDIAKGRGGDHSILGTRDARRFCRQHGIRPDDTDLICWMVESHLVMSATAQKQDLSDPDVIAAFAARIPDDRHLVGLYLLTVADIRGTSPKVWNSWKGKLLENLFFSTRNYLRETIVLPASAHLGNRKREAESILRRDAMAQGIEKTLWSQLDDSYFLRHEAQEIAWHARHLHDQVSSGMPIVKARLVPGEEGVQVLIYTPGYKHLFAQICSFFERTQFTIVEAKIHTTQHGYALDSFVVLDEANRIKHYRDILNYIEFELSQTLADQEPLPSSHRAQRRISRHLKHFPMVPQVSIHPDEKNDYFVLSLAAGDRPGLLSTIARVLLNRHIDVHTAKITTLGERAEDTFLIAGDTLHDDKAVLQLEADLLRQLQPAN